MFFLHNYYYYISETRLKWIPRGHTMVSILSGCGYVLNVKRRTTSGSTVVITVMGRYIFNAGQCWSMLVNARQCFHWRVKEKQIHYLPGDMHSWPHPVEQHIFPAGHSRAPPKPRQNSAQWPTRPGHTAGHRPFRPNRRFSIASRLTIVNDIKAKHKTDWTNVRKKMKEQRNEIHSIINPPDCSWEKKGKALSFPCP